MTPDAPLAVLGIGNLLLTDDGLGPAVVRALSNAGLRDDAANRAGAPAGLPPHTELVDGGTTGLALLPIVAAARALVLVDAVDVGNDPPGTVHVLTGGQIGAAYRPRLTAHQVGASDLISTAGLNGTLPEQFALVGVQPASLALGVGLSAPVAAALPRVLATVRSWSWALHREAVSSRKPTEPADDRAGEGATSSSAGQPPGSDPPRRHARRRL